MVLPGRLTRFTPTFKPLTNVTPFTYRDAYTVQKQIAAIKKYLSEQLTTDFDDKIGQVFDQTEQAVTELAGNVQATVEQWAQLYETFMSDVTASLMAMNDHAVTDLVNDETTLLGKALRDIFPDKQEFVLLENNIDYRLHTVSQELSTQFTELEQSISGGIDTELPLINHIAAGIDQNIAVDMLQAAINAVPEHHVLTIPADMLLNVGEHKITINKPLTLRGGTFKGTGDILEVTSSDVTLENVTLVGRGNTSVFTSSRALLRITGTQQNYLRNITLRNVKVYETDGMGIRLSRVRDFTIERCAVEKYRYAGISCFSCEDGLITQSTVKHGNSHESVGHNCYGISISNDQSLGYKDVSKNIVISYNTVEDNPHWEGIETHNGVNISFLFNIVKGCRRGISIGGAMQLAGAGTNCRVIGNFIDGAGASDEIHNQIIGITIAGTSQIDSPVHRSAIIALNTVLNAHQGGYILYHGDANTASRRYDLDGTAVFGNVFNTDPVSESVSGYHDTRWVDFTKYIEYSWGVSSWVSDPLKVRVISTPRGREIHIKGVASRSSDLTNSDLGRLRLPIRPNGQADVFGPNGKYVVGVAYRSNGVGSARLVLTSTGHLTTETVQGSMGGNWVIDAKFLV